VKALVPGRVTLAAMGASTRRWPSGLSIIPCALRGVAGEGLALRFWWRLGRKER
jgi:hypothetical protein